MEASGRAECKFRQSSSSTLENYTVWEEPSVPQGLLNKDNERVNAYMFTTKKAGEAQSQPLQSHKTPLLSLLASKLSSIPTQMAVRIEKNTLALPSTGKWPGPTLNPFPMLNVTNKRKKLTLREKGDQYISHTPFPFLPAYTVSNIKSKEKSITLNKIYD